MTTTTTTTPTKMMMMSQRTRLLLHVLLLVVVESFLLAHGFSPDILPCVPHVPSSMVMRTTSFQITSPSIINIIHHTSRKSTTPLDVVSSSAAAAASSVALEMSREAYKLATRTQ
jgi:hypothetical protein